MLENQLYLMHLTNSNKAQAANFPFCTIDPNIGKVIVIDQRLDLIN